MVKTKKIVKTQEKEIKKVKKAVKKVEKRVIKVRKFNAKEEVDRYCKSNPLCQVIDSGDGWAIACKIVSLDVRVTTQGNSAFQPYSSENNPYHKVKESYGVMAVITWDKNNLLLNKMNFFWDSFPDVYEVETEGQITYWLDRLGNG